MGERRKKDREKVAGASPDLVKDQIEHLKVLFPEAVCEGKVDFEKLKAALGEELEERRERYSFSWAGKQNAIRLLQTPSRATLIPAHEESVDFDTTGNLFIEGDNLEVLKLLYKPYFGAVKMIYIDPPYNTGNDFVYPDNFADPLDTYLKLTGQKDSEGNLLTSNPETSGRYHSSWLSMMYPRLFLARQLLREDGVIFVSIDDHEVHNLRMLMNEVFGEENFIAELVWEKTRKNDAKLFSVGHEYMVCYSRSMDTLKKSQTIWREEKPGAQEIFDQYRILRERLGSKDAQVEKELQDWYKRLPEKHPSKKLSRYKHVDKWGPWRDRDISWPGGGGPRFDVLHPITLKPCKVPEAGWRFASPESMERQINLGLVEFREDHTQPPFRKAHLLPVPEELDEESQVLEEGEEEGETVGLQVMPSVLYKQAQVAVKYLRKLMGEKLFDNPKDHEVIARLVRYCAGKGNDDIIFDFFGGSATTAQAVLELNREDGGNRRFILVQLPEPTGREDFPTIADIGKERIRRVIAKLKKEKAARLPSGETEDLGFRVFKLAASHHKLWAGVEEKEPAGYGKEMGLFQDPLLPGWSADNILWEVALKEGFGLNSKIEKLFTTEATEGTEGKKAEGSKEVQPAKPQYFKVTDPDKDQHFILCLDETLNPDHLKALNLAKEDLFICRDTALTDEFAANLALQCRLKTL